MRHFDAAVTSLANYAHAAELLAANTPQEGGYAMKPTDLIAAIVAALALAVSAIQWLQSQREHQLALLLGEKETAGYQALRITRRPGARISEDVIRALV